MTPQAPPEVAALLARSNRLGSDPRNTNYAGGNTSAKGEVTDPVTGRPAGVLWVKGSGGDLGTLTEDGLAVLRLDRLRALTGVYPGVEREDEMVAAFDYCLHGLGGAVGSELAERGAAPSIDTAMHGLVGAAHVDHLHPDSGIAFATAADGPALTNDCFGDRVGWIPWRRPGFQLGLVLEFQPLPDAQRRERAAALAPVLRGLAATDHPQVGHFTDSPVVLDFLARRKHPALAALGTSCPDHFLRTKVRPLVLDLPPSAALPQISERFHELHAAYRDEYRAYYERHADATTPPMRGADPAIVLVPGIGMFSFGADKQTARVAGEFYVNAINVMRGAEAVSSYSPIPESEKFRIEYWPLEEAKLRRRPKPRPLATRVALVTGGGSGIGRATARRLAAEGACVVVADRDGEAAERVAKSLGSADVAAAVTSDVTDEASVIEAFRVAALAFGGVDLVVNNAGLSISRPLLETTVADWDVQHDVMARGSFLVSREAARIMLAQRMGGDIVYVCSKNSVAAGPSNLAYGAAKADQAHQVRLLAAELGEHGIRVNGINPDGVVRGSGIFAGGWGAQRAAVYGVPEDELGAFYAQRTLLKREVLPEHVAAAVVVLTAGDLPLTTGLHIPVDAGVAAAFLR